MDDQHVTNREAAIRGNQAAQITVSAARQLEAHERNVLATIPLANTNDYDITLPPIGTVEDGAVFCVRGVRATGSYSNGGVRVVAYGDEAQATKIVDDKMTANTDRVSFMKLPGNVWHQLEDVTT